MPPVVAAAAITATAGVYGASQAKKASKKATKAQQAAADKQLAAQQENFNRIYGMNQPFVQGGQAAYDALLREFGITGAGATASAPAQPMTYDRSGNIVPAPSSVVAAKAVGGSAGTSPVEVVPAGAQVGGNRTSVIGAQGFGGYDGANVVGSGSPGGVDYDKLFTDRPDVRAEYERVAAQADPNSPWYAEHGLDRGAEGFADWWLANKPAADTYAAPTVSAAPASAPAASAAQPAPAATSMPQRPAAQAPPTYERPEGIAAPDYGTAPDLNSFFSKFEEDPGAAYRRDRALADVNAVSAARGKLRSGDAATKLMERSSDLASQEYGNWFARQMQKYTAARSGFENDRGFKFNAYQYDQGRQDKHYADDRAFDTSMWQYGTDRGDRNFQTDRSYADSRSDARTNNLFRLTGVGQTAAGQVSSAGTNNANAASIIYGNQADAASQNAYARANANSQMVGGIAGAATNLFANWGGSSPSTASNPVGSNGLRLWSGGIY